MIEIGSLVDGKYRVLDEVGRGGMSVVYLARNIRTNKQWAIKEVRHEGSNDFDIVKSNLIAETDILKKLDHPNLPNIIDILDDGDSFVIIMDFIEGNSLQHYIKHSGAQPEEDVVRWSIQLCDVLSYLHSRTPPIIYRDMKPANVMLKPDGDVCLIDFGTAREYKETSIEDTKCLGTQGYAAPEQYGGHGQTDARTDIYCLGATMYHLVTGHNPAEPPYEMYPIRQWNPQLSQGLEQIILKCTQKNPDDRYQSCAELMYALEHRDLMDDAVIRSQRRKLALFFTTLMLTILCVVGIFVFGSLHTNTMNRSYEAQVEAAKLEFGTDLDSAFEKFQYATNLAPEKADAYNELLDYIRQDQVITRDEVSLMNSLLNSSYNNQSNNLMTLKSENPKGAAAFCYDYGISLAMMAEESGLNRAETYFEWLTQKDSGGNYVNRGDLSESAMKMSECLYSMSTFMNAAADVMTDIPNEQYAEFWSNAWSLTHDGDTAKSEEALLEQFGNRASLSPIIELRFFQFLVSRIDADAANFKGAGVSVEQMSAMVDLAEQRISADMTKTDSALATVNQVDFDSVRRKLSSLSSSAA